MLSLDDVRAAAARIEGKVRRTPLIAAAPTKRALGAGPVSYKLECLQVTGSFKARGAISKLGTLSAGDIAKGLVTASGGNHGLAIAYAGWLTGRPATIFVPENVSPAKAAEIKEWGAGLIISGSVWDEANRAAGRIVELAEITTSVPTMAARKTEAINFEIIRRHVQEVLLVSDEEMRDAAQFLWFESGLAVDLSGAAAVAALLTGRVRAEAG